MAVRNDSQIGQNTLTNIASLTNTLLISSWMFRQWQIVECKKLSL